MIEDFVIGVGLGINEAHAEATRKCCEKGISSIPKVAGFRILEMIELFQGNENRDEFDRQVPFGDFLPKDVLNLFSVLFIEGLGQVDRRGAYHSFPNLKTRLETNKRLKRRA